MINEHLTSYKLSTSKEQNGCAGESADEFLTSLKSYMRICVGKNRHPIEEQTNRRSLRRLFKKKSQLVNVNAAMLRSFSNKSQLHPGTSRNKNRQVHVNKKKQFGSPHRETWRKIQVCLKNTRENTRLNIHKPERKEFGNLSPPQTKCNINFYLISFSTVAMTRNPLWKYNELGRKQFRSLMVSPFFFSGAADIPCTLHTNWDE